MSIPSGWANTMFGEIAAEPVEQRGPDRSSFIYVDISSIDKSSKRIVSPQQLDSSAAPSRAKQRLRADDVLVSMTRPNLNAVARVPKELDDSIGSTGFCVLRSSHVSTRWLEYRVQAHDFIDAMSGLVQGALYPAVRPRDVLGFSTLLPPRQEQDRIADEIEKQFTRLDDAVAALKRVQASLKRYRASVLKAACEGRLVPTEAELARKEGRSFEPASELLKRILAERRAKWEADQLQKMIAAGKAPKNDEWKKKYIDSEVLDVSDLPQLPEGWAWTSLDGLAQVVGGVTKGQKRKPGETLLTVPYLRVANVQRGMLELGEIKTIEATPQEIEELTLVPGDILFNEGGDRDKLGRGWIWEGQIQQCIHQNHVFRGRLVSQHVHPKYVSWYANSFGQRYFFDEGKQTTNLASLNMTKLKGLPIPLPPWKEQIRIVEELEKQLSDLNSLEAEVQASAQRAEILRRAVLKNAFSGKLLPQNPNDEPASVLLERIRDERARAQDQKQKTPKATNGASPVNGQRRRRVKALAQGVSPGKG